jgi:hypothetical protein
MALEAERAVLAGRLRTIREEAEARDAERGEAVAQLRGELLREQSAARALADRAWEAERAAADAKALASRLAMAPGSCCATPLLPSGPGVGLPSRAEPAGSQGALEMALAAEKRGRADDRDELVRRLEAMDRRMAEMARDSEEAREAASLQAHRVWIAQNETRRVQELAEEEMEQAEQVLQEEQEMLIQVEVAEVLVELLEDLLMKEMVDLVDQE